MAGHLPVTERASSLYLILCCEVLLSGEGIAPESRWIARSSARASGDALRVTGAGQVCAAGDPAAMNSRMNMLEKQSRTGTSSGVRRL